MAAEWKETLETEREISAFMLELGIPAHLRGYYYLIYPVIARRNKTTLQRVERAIRNAEEVSWERGNPEVFEDLFGFSRETGAPRPTNSEYIARIADKIRMDATTGEKHVTERNRTLL